MKVNESAPVVFWGVGIFCVCLGFLKLLFKAVKKRNISKDFLENITVNLDILGGSWLNSESN